MDLPQILCQLYDHAKQYAMMMCVIIMEWWKLHGNISRNGYGNVIIGRYGGCFEEDLRRFTCDRAYHITGFGCTVIRLQRIYNFCLFHVVILILGCFIIIL